MADTPQILVARITGAIARGMVVVRNLLAAFGDSRPQRGTLKPVEPRRLTLAEQWVRLSDIVLGAASRAEEAARCHAAATQQLDLAHYALNSLVDELAAVMDMGARVRRRATVHVLGLPPLPPLRVTVALSSKRVAQIIWPPRRTRP